MASGGFRPSNYLGAIPNMRGRASSFDGRPSCDNNLESRYQEVLKMLRELVPEYGITMQDLKNPTAFKFIQVWCCILEEIGVDLTGICQPSLQRNVMHEGLDQARGLIGLTRCIHAVLLDTGYTKGFLFKDLMEPKSQRLCLRLYHLLNFVIYRLSKDDIIQEVLDKKKYNEERRNNLKHDIDVLSKRIEDLNGIRQQLGPNYITELSQKGQKLDASFKMKTEEKKEIMLKVKEMKDAYGECSAELQNIELAYVMAEKLQKELCATIIKSPERLESELSNKKLKLEELLKEVKFKDSHADAIVRKIAHNQKLESKVQATFDRLDNYLLQCQKRSNKLQQLSERDTELQKCQLRITEELAAYDVLNIAYRSKSERYAALMTQHELALDRHQEEKKHSERNYLKYKEHVNEQEIVVCSLQQELEEKKKMNLLEDKALIDNIAQVDGDLKRVDEKAEAFNKYVCDQLSQLNKHLDSCLLSTEY